MKGWEINAVQLIENNNTGVCPDCGSSDIKVEEFVFGRRKSVSFLCNKCGSSDHFDGFSDDNHEQKI